MLRKLLQSLNQGVNFHVNGKKYSFGLKNIVPNVTSQAKTLKLLTVSLITFIANGTQAVAYTFVNSKNDNFKVDAELIGGDGETGISNMLSRIKANTLTTDKNHGCGLWEGTSNSSSSLQVLTILCESNRIRHDESSFIEKIVLYGHDKQSLNDSSIQCLIDKSKTICDDLKEFQNIMGGIMLASILLITGVGLYLSCRRSASNERDIDVEAKNAELIRLIDSLPDIQEDAFSLLSHDEKKEFNDLLTSLQNQDQMKIQLATYLNYLESRCSLTLTNILELANPITVEANFDAKEEKTRHYEKTFDFDEFKKHIIACSEVNKLAIEPESKDLLSDSHHISIYKGLGRSVRLFVTQVREEITRKKLLHSDAPIENASVDDYSNNCIDINDELVEPLISSTPFSSI